MLSPNGGVNMPIDRLTVMMMPKWIRSTPMALTIGSSSGVKTRIADDGSSTQPTTNSKILMDSRIIQGDRFSESIHCTMDCGMPLTVNSQENTPAAATMISTWEVRYMELTATSQIPFQVMSR